MYVTFEEWTHGRTIASLGTNAGADELPFQTWRNFKEAYAPELVARAVQQSTRAVRRCLDPFGGSGTTALACQFLGVKPTTVEINPYLADLIEAKLTTYNADALAKDLGMVAGLVEGTGVSCPFSYLPRTFIEPGINDRWIFDQAVVGRIAALLAAINHLSDLDHRRLFRVLLGGILVDVSNVVVSGKGRRYRKGWQKRRRDPEVVDQAFFTSARQAIAEIYQYSRRMQGQYELIRGDSRQALSYPAEWDLAVFSPPYPNSFDYTDVYNIELWILGYLRSYESNQILRKATLSSHVQVSRLFAEAPLGCSLLDSTMNRLVDSRASLWDRRIPEMIGAYFADLMNILAGIHARLTPHGSTWMVVGDSCYAGIHIATAEIIANLAEAHGWSVRSLEPCRSMRLSAQQGGRPNLAETLIILDRES